MADGIANVETKFGRGQMPADDFKVGEVAHMCIRPEVIQYSLEPVEGFGIKGQVKNMIFVGSVHRTLLGMDENYDAKINRVKYDTSYNEGDTLYLHWDMEDVTGIHGQEEEIDA